MNNKYTDNFKSAILSKLTEIAETDPRFKISFEKTNKTIDECINYILSTVQKSGVQGYTDDEIYSIAMHYYDEDDIKDVKGTKCQVIVNHTVELTEDEMKEQKEKALQDLYNEQRRKSLSKPSSKPQAEKQKIVQQSLF